MKIMRSSNQRMWNLLFFPFKAYSVIAAIFVLILNFAPWYQDVPGWAYDHALFVLCVGYAVSAGALILGGVADLRRGRPGNLVFGIVAFLMFLLLPGLVVA